MTNEEMVSRANGYCKKMEYEKGDTKYNIAWLAYMAGISNIVIELTQQIKDLKQQVNDLTQDNMTHEYNQAEAERSGGSGKKGS
jgi:hypothetical protein